MRRKRRRRSSLWTVSLIPAKSQSPDSAKSTVIGESPTEVPSTQSLPQLNESKKFNRFFKKSHQKQNHQINYCRIYEALHHDICEFNSELNFYNQKHRKVFDGLLENITALIQSKLPGRCNETWKCMCMGVIRQASGCPGPTSTSR